MSGNAVPQNPVLPEDPFVIIGTRLSLDPSARDAAVPSVGLGVAGGVVQLDADGQIPLQCLRNLIAYLGGSYTPPATGGSTTPTAPTTPTTPTTPVAPAPAGIADAVALADGAFLVDGDGSVLLFPTGEASPGTGGSTATAVYAAVVLPDGATLADGDGVVLLFPVPADTTVTASDGAVVLPDGGDLALPGGDTLVLPAA